MKTWTNFILITFIMMGTVFAIIPEKIRTNLLILGTGTAIDHTIEMDTGDGAANEKIILNGTTKAFSLSDALNVQGNIQADGSMTLGNGTAVDRIVTVDRGGSNPFLKWDETQGVWTFSNDGTLTKKIGSGGGSGSGINLLQNGSAEDGLLNWTASTPAQWTELTATADLLEGEKTFRLDFAAQNDNLVSDAVEIIGGLYGQNCEASIYYSGLPADLVKFRITDGDGDEIAVSELLSDATLSTQKTIYFRCPLSGATANDRTLKLQVIQTEIGNAGAMDFDLAYWGTMRNLANTVITAKWINYTPVTQGFGIVSNVNFRYREIGDSIEIQGYLTAGTVTSVEAQIGLPNSLIIDSNIHSPSIAGYFFRDASSTTSGGAVIMTAGDTFMNFSQSGIFSNQTINAHTPALASSQMLLTGHGVSVNAIIPIQDQVGSFKTIFNSIPTVAENVNALNYRVDGTTASPHTIISSDVSGVIITSTVTGRFVLNYTNLNLAVIPAIDCEAEAPNQNFYCNVVSTSVGLTSTEVEVRISSTGALTDQIFNFAIRKQGNDFRLPSVQPIIINQVSTIYDEGLIVKTCHFTEVASVTSKDEAFAGECDWITSITDFSVFQKDLTWNAFPNKPSCHVTGMGPLGCTEWEASPIITAGRVDARLCHTAADAQIPFVVTCFSRR